MKRLLLATSLAIFCLVVIALIVLLRYDPEVPDDVLRQRLESKLIGHDAKDIDRVFAEEHIERTNQMGMDGIMRDAGHEDIVTLKHIYVRIHTDDQSKVTSIETAGRWVGP
jgi:hypothetical protein